MVIGIDFDGTCVTHDFPRIGRDIGAVPVLKALVDNGHQLILFTMRSDIVDPQSEDVNILTEGGTYLTDAVNWFKEHGIELYGIQTNPTQKAWTHSPKAYCGLYIDDTALGVPLIHNLFMSSRPYVDWYAVRELLYQRNIL